MTTLVLIRLASTKEWPNTNQVKESNPDPERALPLLFFSGTFAHVCKNKQTQGGFFGKIHRALFVATGSGNQLPEPSGAHGRVAALHTGPLRAPSRNDTITAVRFSLT